MKKLQKVSGMLVLGLLAGGMGMAAEELSGRVTEVFADKDKIVIQTVSSTGGQADKIELKTTDQSRLEGITSLRDLSVGDEVRFEAEKAIMGARKVIRLSKVAAPASGGSGQGQSASAGQQSPGASVETRNSGSY